MYYILVVVTRGPSFIVTVIVLRVVSVSCSLDLCVESVLMIGGVVDLPEGAVGFLDCVVAFDYVAVSRLVLALHVVGVRVVDAVFELVVGVGL